MVGHGALRASLRDDTVTQVLAVVRSRVEARCRGTVLQDQPTRTTLLQSQCLSVGRGQDDLLGTTRERPGSHGEGPHHVDNDRDARNISQLRNTDETMINIVILVEATSLTPLGYPATFHKSWDRVVPSFGIDIRSSADHQLPPEPVDKRCS